MKIIPSHPFICSYIYSSTRPSIQLTILHLTNNICAWSHARNCDEQDRNSLCTHAWAGILSGEQAFNNCKDPQENGKCGMEGYPRQGAACVHSFIHVFTHSRAHLFTHSLRSPQLLAQRTSRSTTKCLLSN